MKHLYRIMMLPLLVLPLLLASCEKDTDSNPTLDLSHVSEGFVLNTPAYAENNTYDLANSESVELSCSQPNYGEGVPYVVRYYVQLAIDPAFKEAKNEAAFEELSTSFTTARMNVSAAEINNALVNLYQTANPGKDVPETMPVYVKLRAVLDGTMTDTLGQTYSNVITLNSVRASYQAPDAELPTNLFVIGSSIQNAWNSWKEVPQAAGLKGNYFTVVYVPAGGQFKWSETEGIYRDYTNLRSVTDKANAGITCNTEDYNNIKVGNGGWYTLFFTAEITPDGKSINYDLTVYPAEIYIFGTVNGGTWSFDDNWKLSTPEYASGEWVSPAFTASGELRVSVKVPDVDWYRTEFTILNGKLFFGNPTDNWATNFGSDYSVACSVGQKLYLNMDMNTGEVK